jgi:hypothetical protein
MHEQPVSHAGCGGLLLGMAADPLVNCSDPQCAWSRRQSLKGYEEKYYLTGMFMIWSTPSFTAHNDLDQPSRSRRNCAGRVRILTQP